MPCRQRLLSLLRSSLLLSSALVAACVTEPTDDGTVASRLPTLTLRGYAAVPRAPLQLRAWNLERGGWDIVATFDGGTSVLGDSPPMYAWSQGARLGNRYWVTAGSSCAAPGSARLQVRELNEGSWIPLKTFDAAGKQCLADEINAGQTYAAAGSDCTTGEEVVVLAPSSCVPAVGAGPGLLDLLLTASDDVSAWSMVEEPEFGTVWPTIGLGRTLHLRADAFGSKAVGRITVTADVTVYCRPTGSTTDTAVTRAFARSSTATAPGGTGAGTLGAGLDLDGGVLRPLCPASTTLRRAQVHPRVDAVFTDGTRGANGYLAPGGYVYMTF